MLTIEGSSAVVTGGASGLGKATAETLATRGMKVIIADIDEEQGAAVASATGGRFVRTDVADGAQAQAAVDAAVALAPLRVLVNCAGLGRPARTVDRDGNPFDLADFEFVIRVNLIGTFNCLRLAAAAMAKTDPLQGNERGVIVNTASVAAFEGQIGQAAYAASKGGIVGLTLPVARDLAVLGIRVNTIAPGLIDTPIYGHGESADAFKAKLASSVLFPNRLGTAEEFAAMALEVITNSYVNGETIRIDGGLRMPPK